MDKQMVAMGLALVISVALIYLVMYLTREPVVVLEEVKDRPTPRVLSQHIRSAIRLRLSERQITRQEILNGFEWPSEKTAVVLDQMIRAGDVIASDGSKNPYYTLAHRTGVDVV